MGATFAIAQEYELTDARKKHMTNIHNVAEGYAIILEELDEFWDWVRKKPKHRDPHKMYKELVQVAAMAQRTAEDCIFPHIHIDA